MPRRLVNLLTALSLLLCVAVLVLWVRSSSRYDLAGVRLGPVGLGAGSYRGHLLWLWAIDPGERTVKSNYDSGWVSPHTDAIADYIRLSAAWRVLGFSYTLIDSSGPPFRGFITPAWSAALLAGVLPAWRLWRYGSRRQRSAGGLCPSCGYDLRATPGRCPECGTSAPTSPT